MSESTNPSAVVPAPKGDWPVFPYPKADVEAAWAAGAWLIPAKVWWAQDKSGAWKYKKVPTGPWAPWPTRDHPEGVPRPDLDSLIRAQAIGWVPIGTDERSRFMVLDLDQGDPTALLQEYPPAHYWCTSEPSRLHLIYTTPEHWREPVGNGTWSYAGCSGEKRADKGWVLVWPENGLGAIARLLSDPTIKAEPPPVLVPAVPVDRTPDVWGFDFDSRADPSEAADALRAIPVPQDRDAWMRLGMAAKAAGLSKNEFLAWSSQGSKFDEGEDSRQWESWSENGGIGPGTLFKVARDEGWKPERSGLGVAAFSSVSDPQASQKLQTGRFLSWSESLEAGLDFCGYGLRLNSRNQQTEIREPGSTRWVTMTDPMRGLMREMLAKNCTGLVYSRGRPKKDQDGKQLEREIEEVSMSWSDHTFRQVLDAYLRLHTVDPFDQWLEGLPEWDRTERLTRWISELWGIHPDTDPALAEWVGRYILGGVVYRTKHPGHKLDFVPVLISDEGFWKSGSLQYLFPEEMRGLLFVDNFSISQDPASRVEQIIGKGVVELSEMRGLDRVDINNLKAFVTQQNDGNRRLAYRRDPVTIWRSCIFVGTSNHPDGAVPNDEAGNRRFIPIRLSGRTDFAKQKEYLDVHRHQLWAEALWCWNQKQNLWIPDHLKEAHREAIEQHRIHDWGAEATVSDFLANQNRKPFTLKTLMECKFQDSASDQRMIGRVVKALRHAGWQSTRRMVDGRRESWWEPPEQKPNELDPEETDSDPLIQSVSQHPKVRQAVQLLDAELKEIRVVQG